MRSSMIPPITARNPPNRIGPVYMITPAIIAASPNNASNNRRNMEIGDSPPLVSGRVAYQGSSNESQQEANNAKEFHESPSGYSESEHLIHKEADQRPIYNTTVLTPTSPSICLRIYRAGLSDYPRD